MSCLARLQENLGESVCLNTKFSVLLTLKIRNRLLTGFAVLSFILEIVNNAKENFNYWLETKMKLFLLKISDLYGEFHSTDVVYVSYMLGVR